VFRFTLYFRRESGKPDALALVPRTPVMPQGRMQLEWPMTVGPVRSSALPALADFPRVQIRPQAHAVGLNRRRSGGAAEWGDRTLSGAGKGVQGSGLPVGGGLRERVGRFVPDGRRGVQPWLDGRPATTGVLSGLLEPPQCSDRMKVPAAAVAAGGRWYGTVFIKEQSSMGHGHGGLLGGVVLLAALAGQADAQLQDWNNLGGNGRMNGLVNVNGPDGVGASDLLWEGGPFSIIAWKPVIEGRRVFMVRQVDFPFNNSPPNDGVIYAMNLDTGEILWTATLPFEPDDWTPWIAGVKNGRLFASRSGNGGSMDSPLYCGTPRVGRLRPDMKSRAGRPPGQSSPMTATSSCRR
jgi:hypothetical protein